MSIYIGTTKVATKGILVDDTLSSSSDNPVTNSAITTALGNKQDTLVSGTNIKTVNNNSLLGSGNIDVDGLPSQTGQSGKFLTTDGSSASWAAVNVPEGVYTQDNLIAGDNISITAETSGGDADTLLLCHFDDSINDSSSREVVAQGYTAADYGPLPIDATYVTGKFGKALDNTDYRYARYYHNDYQTELETSNEATIDFLILKDPNNYGYSYMTKLNINNTTDMSLFCYSSSVFAIYDPIFGGSLDNADIDISSVTENTYFHIAMVYKNAVLKVYLNGVLQKTGTYNTSYLTCKGYIGLLAGINATIDELRVSSVARWDSDFTPPSTPYGGSTPTGRYLINNTMPAVSVDSKSITTNSSDELQTVGVIDQNDTTKAIKTWTGTKAQYDAIVTKDADTIYNTTDEPGDSTEFADTSLSNLSTIGQAIIDGKVSKTGGTMYPAAGERDVRIEAIDHNDNSMGELNFIQSSIGDNTVELISKGDIDIRADEDGSINLDISDDNGSINLSNITGDINLTTQDDEKLQINGVSFPVKSSLYAMPSDSYINLTIGASGTSYIAPANGWAYFSTWTTATVISYFQLANLSTNIGILPVPPQGAGYQQKGYIPCRKGDIIYLAYANLDMSRSDLKFVYAEGSKSEAN